GHAEARQPHRLIRGRPAGPDLDRGTIVGPGNRFRPRLDEYIVDYVPAHHYSRHHSVNVYFTYGRSDYISAYSRGYEEPGHSHRGRDQPHAGRPAGAGTRRPREASGGSAR